MSQQTISPVAAGASWQDHNIGIAGFGHHFPREVVHNDPDSEVVGNRIDEAVLGQVGVRSRHKSSEDETLLSLAVAAARQAVEDSGVDPAELDLVILTNWTEHVFRPELAPLVATEIGAHGAMAFDLAAGCSGFVLGIQTAAAYLCAPTHHTKALVVSAEQFSRRVRPGSKAEAVAGDGSGAAVITRGGDHRAQLLDSVTHVDGTLVDLTTATPPHGWVKSKPELVEQAAAHISSIVSELLERNSLALTDVTWLVPHAATRPIIDGILSRTGVPDDKLVTNFEYRGHLSSACVPTVLSEFHAKAHFSPGDTVLTPVVAGGFFSGGLLLRF